MQYDYRKLKLCYNNAIINKEEEDEEHASILPGKERLKEILEGHEKNCLVAFCMEPRIFKDIATFLREEHILHDIRGVTVEEKLGMFLFMLIYNMNSNISVFHIIPSLIKYFFLAHDVICAKIFHFYFKFQYEY
ncbi:hypothetical protein ACJX0J_030953 [Zea mays]